MDRSRRGFQGALEQGSDPEGSDPFWIAQSQLVVARRAGVVVVVVAFAPARTGFLGRRRLAAAVRVVHGRRLRWGRRRRGRRCRRRSGCNRRRNRRRRCRWRRGCRYGRLTRGAARGRRLLRRWLRSPRRRLSCRSRRGSGRGRGRDECDLTLRRDQGLRPHRDRRATSRRMRAEGLRRDRHRRRRGRGTRCLLARSRGSSRRLQGRSPKVAGGHRCATERNETQ
jgi:hypothetical protein